MKEIRDWLNENGIKNPVGGAFTYNSVEHMLKNRRYIGELKFRDVVVPDAVPPIIPLELFEDVQEKIAKNKKAPARRKAEDDYLLTTKLFCGYCGALMFGESGTSRTGEVHRYYKCATAKKHKGCKKKTVRKQWLEDLVVNQTMQLVKDDAAMESIIAKVMELQNKENTNIPLYEKQLRDAELGIQNMLNAIQAGILTSSTKERLEQLEETKRELEARIAEEKLAKPKVTEEFIRFWLLRFRKLDMSLKDQRQALVDTFINAIYLYDDKVLITFNYKEGTETVAFGEAVKAEKCKGKQLVVRHWVIVTDVIRFLDQFTIDLFALFHDVSGIFPAVFLCQNLFHRAFEHPEIKTVIFHIAFPPVIYLQTRKTQPSRRGDRSSLHPYTA